MQRLIDAIRNDELVGRGTCSSIDECYDDIDLVDSLNEENITTPEGAVKWAREREGLWQEKGSNARWGEDNDLFYF